MVTHSYGGNRGSNGFTTGANGLGEITKPVGERKVNAGVREHVLDEEDVTIYWQAVQRRHVGENVEFHPQQYVDLRLTPLTLRVKGQKRGKKKPKFSVHVVTLADPETPSLLPCLSPAQARNMALMTWQVLNEQSDFFPSTLTADLIDMDIIPEKLRKEKSHGQVEA